jgi:hypothetical protein
MSKIDEKALVDAIFKAKEEYALWDNADPKLWPLVIHTAITAYLAARQPEAPQQPVEILETTDVQALLIAYDTAKERGLPLTSIQMNVDTVRKLLGNTTKRKSGWLSVDEMLPPYEKKVLAWWRPIDNNPWAETVVIADRCYVERPHADEGNGAYQPGCWFANGRYYPEFHITHWLPLPKIPADSKLATAMAEQDEDDRRRGSDV